MRRLVLALVVSSALVAAPSVASTPAWAQVPRGELARALVSPKVDGRRTGAMVFDLASGRLVFEKNASLSLSPASAEKLPVAFAALRLLGPGYQFRTEVIAEGELTGSTLRGNLFLVGYGDPTLRRKDLESLAAQVRRTGIRRVTGGIVGDERHFDARRDVDGWKATYLGKESRPLSALALTDVLAPTVNAAAPAAASSLTAALERRGVAIVGLPKTGRAPTDIVPVAVDYSPTLSRIVLTMNRRSDNFVAEMLLKELGAAVAGAGTSAAGASVVRQALVDAGVSGKGVRIVDGSGLSLLDRVTAQSLVELLRAVADDPEIRAAFVASLPVSGLSGTLRDRLRGPRTRGKVAAKTGTTSRASALAGYVKGRYAFAILQNGAPVSYGSARAAQDRFVTVLARS